jgi:hypothetical protein
LEKVRRYEADGEHTRTARDDAAVKRILDGLRKPDKKPDRNKPKEA